MDRDAKNGVSAPKITQEPQDFICLPGGKALLSVKVEAHPEAEYQWYFQNEMLAGATDKKLVIKNARPENSGGYTCRIRNVAGTVISRKSQLTVLKERPSDMHLALDKDPVTGANVTLRVEGSGIPKEGKFEWFFSGRRIPGVDSQKLEFPQISPQHQGQYKAVLTVGTEMLATPVFNLKLATAAQEEDDFFFVPSKTKKPAAKIAAQKQPEKKTALAPQKIAENILPLRNRRAALLKKKEFLEKLLQRFAELGHEKAPHKYGPAARGKQAA